MTGHFKKHAKEFGDRSQAELASKAVHFANEIDRINYRSVIDKWGTTYKYDPRDGRLVIVSKEGYVVTYYTVKKEFHLRRQERKKENDMDTKTKQIKPMMCPVCGRFYFDKLNEDELKAGETPNETQCSRCGWYYDLEQTKDPSLKKQSNEMSLREYKEWYRKKIAENPKWDYFEEHMPPSNRICAQSAVNMNFRISLVTIFARSAAGKTAVSKNTQTNKCRSAQ